MPVLQTCSSLLSPFVYDCFVVKGYSQDVAHRSLMSQNAFLASILLQ